MANLPEASRSRDLAAQQIGLSGKTAEKAGQKESRNKRIFDLWMQCYTQEEIADAVGMSQRGVSKILEQMEDLRFVLKPGDLYHIQDEAERLDQIERRNKALATHLTDFDPPLYNIWMQCHTQEDSLHPALSHRLCGRLKIEPSAFLNRLIVEPVKTVSLLKKNVPKMYQA